MDPTNDAPQEVALDYSQPRLDTCRQQRQEGRQAFKTLSQQTLHEDNRGGDGSAPRPSLQRVHQEEQRDEDARRTQPHQTGDLPTQHNARPQTHPQPRPQSNPQPHRHRRKKVSAADQPSNSPAESVSPRCTIVGSMTSDAAVVGQDEENRRRGESGRPLWDEKGGAESTGRDEETGTETKDSHQYTRREGDDLPAHHRPERKGSTTAVSGHAPRTGSGRGVHPGRAITRGLGTFGFSVQRPELSDKELAKPGDKQRSDKACRSMKGQSEEVCTDSARSKEESRVATAICGIRPPVSCQPSGTRKPRAEPISCRSARDMIYGPPAGLAWSGQNTDRSEVNKVGKLLASTGSSALLLTPTGSTALLPTPTGSSAQHFTSTRLRDQLTTPTGLNAQLTTPTGLNAQLPTPTGLNAQLPTPAGLNAQHFTPTGVNAQHFTPTGLNAQHFTPTGLNAQHFTPTELNTQHFTSKGLYALLPPPTGLNAQHFTSIGLNVQHFTSTGLNAQLPTPTGSSAQLPTHTRSNAQLPTPTGLNAQLPTPTGSSAQLPTPTGLSAQYFAFTGLNPQHFTSSVLNAQLPTPTGINAQHFTSTGLNARHFTPTGLNAQHFTSTGLNARHFTSTGLNAQHFTPTGLNAQLPTLTGLNAQLFTSSGLNTQLLTPTGLNAQHFTSPGLNTQLPNPTGINVQLFTSTGLNAQLPNPTGLSAQNFTSTGLNAQLPTPIGLNAQHFTSTGFNAQLPTPTGLNAQHFTPTGLNAQLPAPTGLSTQILTPTRLNAQQLIPTGLNAQQLIPTGINAQRFIPAGINAQYFTPTGISAQYFTPTGINTRYFTPTGNNVQYLTHTRPSAQHLAATRRRGHAWRVVAHARQQERAMMSRLELRGKIFFLAACNDNLVESLTRQINVLGGSIEQHVIHGGLYTVLTDLGFRPHSNTWKLSLPPDPTTLRSLMARYRHRLNELARQSSQPPPGTHSNNPSREPRDSADIRHDVTGPEASKGPGHDVTGPEASKGPRHDVTGPEDSKGPRHDVTGPEDSDGPGHDITGPENSKGRGQNPEDSRKPRQDANDSRNSRQTPIKSGNRRRDPQVSRAPKQAPKDYGDLSQAPSTAKDVQWKGRVVDSSATHRSSPTIKDMLALPPSRGLQMVIAAQQQNHQQQEQQRQQPPLPGKPQQQEEEEGTTSSHAEPSPDIPPSPLPPDSPQSAATTRDVSATSRADSEEKEGASSSEQQKQQEDGEDSSRSPPSGLSASSRSSASSPTDSEQREGWLAMTEEEQEAWMFGEMCETYQLICARRMGLEVQDAWGFLSGLTRQKETNQLMKVFLKLGHTKKKIMYDRVARDNQKIALRVEHISKIYRPSFQTFETYPRDDLQIRVPLYDVGVAENVGVGVAGDVGAADTGGVADDGSEADDGGVADDFDAWSRIKNKSKVIDTVNAELRDRWLVAMEMRRTGRPDSFRTTTDLPASTQHVAGVHRARAEDVQQTHLLPTAGDPQNPTNVSGMPAVGNALGPAQDLRHHGDRAVCRQTDRQGVTGAGPSHPAAVSQSPAGHGDNGGGKESAPTTTKAGSAVINVIDADRDLEEGTVTHVASHTAVGNAVDAGKAVDTWKTVDTGKIVDTGKKNRRRHQFEKLEAKYLRGVHSHCEVCGLDYVILKDHVMLPCHMRKISNQKLFGELHAFVNDFPSLDVYVQTLLQRQKNGSGSSGPSSTDVSSFQTTTAASGPTEAVGGYTMCAIATHPAVTTTSHDALMVDDRHDYTGSTITTERMAGDDEDANMDQEKELMEHDVDDDDDEMTEVLSPSAYSHFLPAKVGRGSRTSQEDDDEGHTADELDTTRPADTAASAIKPTTTWTDRHHAQQLGVEVNTSAVQSARTSTDRCPSSPRPLNPDPDLRPTNPAALYVTDTSQAGQGGQCVVKAKKSTQHQTPRQTSMAAWLGENSSRDDTPLKPSTPVTHGLRRQREGNAMSGQKLQSRITTFFGTRQKDEGDDNVRKAQSPPPTTTTTATTARPGDTAEKRKEDSRRERTPGHAVHTAHTRVTPPSTRGTTRSRQQAEADTPILTGPGLPPIHVTVTSPISSAPLSKMASMGPGSPVPPPGMTSPVPSSPISPPKVTSTGQRTRQQGRLSCNQDSSPGKHQAAFDTGAEEMCVSPEKRPKCLPPSPAKQLDPADTSPEGRRKTHRRRLTQLSSTESSKAVSRPESLGAGTGAGACVTRDREGSESHGDMHAASPDDPRVHAEERRVSRVGHNVPQCDQIQNTEMHPSINSKSNPGEGESRLEPSQQVPGKACDDPAKCKRPPVKSQQRSVSPTATQGSSLLNRDKGSPRGRSEDEQNRQAEDEHRQQTEGAGCSKGDKATNATKQHRMSAKEMDLLRRSVVNMDLECQDERNTSRQNLATGRSGPVQQRHQHKHHHRQQHDQPDRRPSAGRLHRSHYRQVNEEHVREVNVLTQEFDVMCAVAESGQQPSSDARDDVA